MKSISALVLVLIFIFAGCIKPSVDASSDEKMKESIKKVRASLPEEKRDEFDGALKVLAFDSVDLTDIFNPTPTIQPDEKLKQTLEGKTAEEILAAAERILKERAAKEREQALQEIKELREKKAEAEAAKNELIQFKVKRSRFYKAPQKYGRPKPIIELKVVNNTPHPVSRAYFKGTLASPGRAVPWLQEDFNYQISGGLEPGEEVHWRLAPNMFSDWGTVEVPKDAILTVDVVRLDGADGKALYSADVFTERDAERLDVLIKKYPEK